ncbi:MAG: DMT family transporter [Endozoicomonas sp. (ex Botrylloides leachii)]|nr:DMT family transporter [Endozoicomonas sp. (ex Botrylloides leachii)]
MIYLSGVTLLWSFSFSLIGVYLAGQVDPYFSVLSRVLLASCVFLPFLRIKGLPRSMALKLMAIGGTQLGLMYLFYYQSFLYLSVPEVLLFTVFTPIYITLIYDLMNRNFSPWYLLTAVIAVLGAIIIQFNGMNEGYFKGFMIIQGANICMAMGQVAYKVLLEKEKLRLSQHQIFGWFYLGALTVAATAYLLLGDMTKLPTTYTQWGILGWLGIVASGLGYFFWNKGACKVNPGALAIMNNALIPAGLIVNIAIWNRDVDLTRLGLGGGVILLSLLVNEYLIKPDRRIPLSN